MTTIVGAGSSCWYNARRAHQTGSVFAQEHNIDCKKYASVQERDCMIDNREASNVAVDCGREVKQKEHRGRTEPDLHM